ncbi:MAG: hypothetical protein PHE03_04185 [Bacteroidales bacterium]|nr:hypothetical protein [Bacteroidales bacterium]MDD3891481.1 hypothetical protein [Bacteroidales bacterium]
MRVVFFKTPKPRQFKYTPIFYNPEKEALKEREQQLKQELGLSDAETPRVSLIKGQFRRHYEGKVKGRAKTKSNFRLILIFIALCLLAYYMLN